MKKLLGVLLAIAMSWPAGATVLSNVEVKGEIQTIASDAHHNQFQAYNSGVNARVLAGLSAELVEDVTANILFLYADQWGDDGQEGRSMDDYWESIYVANANVVLHNLFCAFDLTVGRQFYGDEDSAVMYIGPNHYNAEGRPSTSDWENAAVRSIDAAKLVYSDDVKTFTMIAGTIENQFYTGDDYKQDMYGADFRMNITDNLNAQVYGYDFVSRGEDKDYYAEDRHAGFYGAKVGMNVEAVRASVEYARNFGDHRLIKEHKDTGYMVKADVAADIEKVTARGAFLYAKEGFWARGNYTPGLLIGHLLGGYGAGVWNYTRDNGVRMFNVGLDFKPFEKWVFSLDGYTFQARTGHATTYEADLTAKYNHNEYVQLFAGIGYAKYTDNNNYNAVFAQDRTKTPDNFKGQIGMLIKF